MIAEFVGKYSVKYSKKQQKKRKNYFFAKKK
jgi:hypothetical protein